MKFQFASVGRIVFGRGESKRLPEFVREFGTRAVVIHNGKAADNLLECAKIRQKGEPTVADVDHAVDVARSEKCDVIVGIGGGSALDAAKAVAGLVTNGGSALDYLEVVGKGQKISKPALPWIAVPTTAGTGAEVTRNTVVTAPDKKFKASIRSELLLASLAVVDPELQLMVPRDVTAASGMDAMAQCIESFTSKSANPMTDGLAIEGTRMAARWLARACERGKDIEAREGMAIAAMLSGITLTNAGLGAVHGFAAPIGGNFTVPHGVVCAALLPGVIAANVDQAKRQGRGDVLGKYAEVGRALSGEALMADAAAVDTCGAFAAQLVRELDIPGLKNYGMRKEHVPEIVELAKRASSMKHNPVELPDEVLSAVLLEAIER